MSNFHVGQKVVCIGHRKLFGHPYDLCNWPVKGGVYTIGSITDHGGDKVLLTLREVDNSHMVPEYSRLEPGFPYQRFRPVAERKTDISCFTAMLEPKKARVDA